MAALKAHEVARFLTRPDVDEGIFLAYGPDAGLVRETAQRLIRKLSGDDPESASIVTLDGSEVDADPSILAVEAKTISLFGGKRIVRVRGAGKSLVMTLTELRDDMQGASIVLEAGNLPPRDALRALVEAAKNGRALPCYPDSDEALAALIRDTFNQQGIRVDADVVGTLREILGNDREITRRELEKLCLYAAASKELSREDVLLLCADNGMLVIDAILDATGGGHAERLELALNRALSSAVDPQRLLRMCMIHFDNLRRWRTEVDAGKAPRAVLDGQRPKPHFSRIGALEQQLRLWSDNALATASARILQTTADTRRRPGLAEPALRRTLLAICMMAAAR
ncbi:DNA polymerase III subunit delta [Devosia neptuniae]|jgi:DNA polymerase-3 subunit delta|uniref:DNA polymerase III subunit delta n=1 Tax=Devosia TaxID=46913 RepID=UPI0022AE76B7|nr:DNA polymerase III subunit delta [Devosia neptuniae]MCZ4347397.1 DNA polymerase III subunit delta [Devosia neptuniae]|tara:strand:- start:5312 stop:6334 length:1023 start_codon:yes stop_codon:yes gene_type:complete